ncbi:MAG: hypothetical protein WCC52_01090 [Nitrosotalea sp.]
MNKKILIAVGVAIVAIMMAITYLEQGESKIAIINNPISNVTQSTNQATATSIAFTTDKSSYNMGDAIVISGDVKSPVAGTPVTILILDPNNLLLQAERISVSPDGSFQTTITTTPAIWKLGGTYAVSIQYGSSNVKAQKTFYFTG